MINNNHHKNNLSDTRNAVYHTNPHQQLQYGNEDQNESLGAAFFDSANLKFITESSSSGQTFPRIQSVSQSV